jgi:hypothetical protein
VNLVNPPSWVRVKPLTLNATHTNATLLIGAAKDAPKTKVTLTVRASAQGSADQTASLDMKVVTVSPVTSKYGNALVYDTTKILNSETLHVLTSYSMDRVVFSKMTAQLQSLERGDVISAPPPASPLVPGGFFLTVLSVHQEGGSVVVEARRASLLEAVQEIHVGLPPNLSGLKATGGAGMEPSFAPALGTGDIAITVYDGHVGFGPTNVAKEGYAEAKVDATVTIQLWMMLDVSIETTLEIIPTGVNVYAYLHINVLQSANAYLKGNKGSELDWVNPDLATIFKQQFPIVPGILWIESSGSIEGRASGQLTQDVNLNFQEAFSIRVGPQFEQWNGRGLYLWCHYGPSGDACSSGIDFTKSVQNIVPPEVGAGTVSQARFGLGPRLDASINGGIWELAKAKVGGFISANLFFEFDSDNTKKPRWWVDGGVDGQYGINFGLSVLFGLAQWGDEWSFPIGELLRFRFINGPLESLPPTVTIIYPQPDQAIDVSSGIMASGFKATAIDPQDGDLCSIPGANLVWTDDDGQIGTGCNLQGVWLEREDDHIVFTATDAEGKSASFGPVHITVMLPEPKPYITSPAENDHFTVNRPVTLEGGASLGVTDLSCDKITFTYTGPGGTSPALLTSKDEYNPMLCKVDLNNGFPSIGDWEITITAWSKPGGYSATKSVKVNVKEAPQNPYEEGPWTEIDAPTNNQEFPYRAEKILLQGTVTSSVPDAKIQDYAWTVETTRSAQVIAQGDLSRSCNKPGCTLTSYSWIPLDICKANNYSPVEVTIELDARQADQNGKLWDSADPAHIQIMLTCGVPPASVFPPSPVLSLSWASWGGILVDRMPTSWMSCKGGLGRLLLRLKKRMHETAAGDIR